MKRKLKFKSSNRKIGIPDRILYSPDIFTLLGIGDIEIGEEASLKNSRLSSDLNLGLFGGEAEFLSLFASSENSTFEGRRINALLIPYCSQGSLLVNRDNSAVGADTFYSWVNGKPGLVHTDSPVSLDGLIATHNSVAFGYKGPKHVLLNNLSSQELTHDKVKTKQVWVQAGVKTPEYVAIAEEDNISDRLKGFLQSHPIRYVVKPATESVSRGVRFFNPNQESEALQHITDLRSVYGGKVILERRIEPMKWPNEQADWNIRCLVSLTENPRYIDGYIRWKLGKNGPVSMSSGAKSIAIKHAPWFNEQIYGKIKHDAEQAAKAVYEELKKLGNIATGVIAMDLIPEQKNGQINTYFLEAATSGFGGFYTLSRLSYKEGIFPLSSVRKLLEEFGPFLAKNHERDINKTGFTRSPNEVECFNFANFLIEIMNKNRIVAPQDEFNIYANGAIHLFGKAIALRPGFILPHLGLAQLYEGIGDYYTKRESGDAKRFYDLAIVSYQRVITMDVGKADEHFSFGIQGLRATARKNLGIVQDKLKT